MSTPTAAVRFGLLGPLAVEVDGEPVRLGGPKERLVLAALLLARGRVVSRDRLVDVLWEDDPPESAVAAVQVHVSNLRRRLGAAGAAIATRAPGYVLTGSPGTVDLLRMEELVDGARAARERADTVTAARLLGEAESLWRGAALDDLDGTTEFVRGHRATLHQRRVVAGEEHVTILLADGDEQAALALLDRLLEVEPLWESLWAKRIVALYRLGQQAAALAAFRRCRELLLDELGVEPTPRLRALETAVLQQDPALDRVPPAPETPSAPSTPAVAALPTTFLEEQVDAELVLPDGTTVTLDAPVSIGRNPDCTVVVDDRAASRVHAEIRPAVGGHLLSDRGSRNGTRVDGLPVEHHRLQDGERVGVGSWDLVYRVVRRPSALL